jgi:hypothetical protein
MGCLCDATACGCCDAIVDCGCYDADVCSLRTDHEVIIVIPDYAYVDVPPGTSNLARDMLGDVHDYLIHKKLLARDSQCIRV